MSALENARRRHLATKGRPMTLKRPGAPVTTPPPYTTVTVQGFLTRFTPGTGGEVMQTEARIAIMADVLAGWDDGIPAQHDIVVDDAESWAVQKAEKVYDGALLIGFNLHVEGGNY